MKSARAQCQPAFSLGSGWEWAGTPGKFQVTPETSLWNYGREDPGGSRSNPQPGFPRAAIKAVEGHKILWNYLYFPADTNTKFQRAGNFSRLMEKAARGPAIWGSLLPDFREFWWMHCRNTAPSMALGGTSRNSQPRAAAGAVWTPWSGSGW